MTAAAAPLRVLCVEDDPLTAILIRRALEREGYAVEIAATGTVGLARYDAERWDVVLIDHALPDLTGLEVLVRMATIRERPATVMVSGRGSEAVVVQALKEGVHDYLVKDGADSYLLLLPEVVARARKVVAERAAAAAHAAERERLVVELTEALSKIKTLAGLIPICAGCKSIRNDHGFWQSLEAYLAQHTDAMLSHGLCPTCAPRYFPDTEID